MTAPTGCIDDFELRSFEVNGASITARVSKLVLGEALRPALLLLHGFPQSHVMSVAAAWRTGWPVNRLFKPLPLWQAQCSGAVTGHAGPAGHFIPEEKPDETAKALREFLSDVRLADKAGYRTQKEDKSYAECAENLKSFVFLFATSAKPSRLLRPVVRIRPHPAP